MGFAKIHVDAGARQGRGGSAATICRDRDGNYLGSSALVIPGVEDPATLEAIACREALALASDLHIQNFAVASDCKQVISDINKGVRGRYGAVISEIQLQSVQFHCNFTFESHAVNVEAHSLAKFALTLGQGATSGMANPMIPLVSHNLWLSMNKTWF